MRRSPPVGAPGLVDGVVGGGDAPMHRVSLMRQAPCMREVSCMPRFGAPTPSATAGTDRALANALSEVNER